MRISDWSSDVCSSDLALALQEIALEHGEPFITSCRHELVPPPRRLGYGGANEEAEMGGAMLPQAPSYEELTARFRWQVPEHYNIGVDACDRWADTDRLALIHLDADGREARYSFRDLQRLSNRCANVLAAQEIGKA